MPPEAIALLDIAMTVKRQKFLEFIDLWMERLSFRTRKDLSHNGALCSNSGDPVHYICKHTGRGYFDPTNAIYSMSLCFLGLLTNSSSGLNRDWNIETRGDICEALMGFSYQLLHNERADVLKVGQQVHKVARIIEVTAYTTYKLWINTGMAFKDWCARILSYDVQEYNVQHLVAHILAPIASDCPPRPKMNMIAVTKTSD